MRESIARVLCLFTVAVVVALAHTFAVRHNPDPRGRPGAVAAVVSAAAASAAAPTAAAVRGREIYDAQGCATCHAIAGAGNPRHPLDGVGTRRSTAELKDWILGAGAAADEISPAVARRKRGYRTLAESDLAALVAYLATLREKP